MNETAVLTFIFNVRSGVVHKVWDGATNESCNVDAIPRAHRKEHASLEDVQREWAPRVKICKRCFRGTVRGSP